MWTKNCISLCEYTNKCITWLNQWLTYQQRRCFGISHFFFLDSPGCIKNFPDQGLNSCVLHWKCLVLTTGPPWKSEKMIEIKQKSWCIRARRAPGDHFIKAQRGDQPALVHTANWSQQGLLFWPLFTPSRTSVLHWAVRTHLWEKKYLTISFPIHCSHGIHFDVEYLYYIFSLQRLTAVFWKNPF